MSPDVFLSRNGIRYDGNGLPGTPSQIVSNLLALNGMRTYDSASGEFLYNQYTPQFVPAPFGPNSFDPALARAENAAVQAYKRAESTGDLGLVYAAADTINEIRSIKGGVVFRPKTDFEIVAAANNYLGYTARVLISDRQRFLDGETPAAPWFFTVAGYEALNAYRNEQLWGTTPVQTGGAMLSDSESARLKQAAAEQAAARQNSSNLA